MGNEAQKHPFDELVNGPEGQIRLAEAALLFAADEYPDLTLNHYVQRLDILARRVAGYPAFNALQRINALRQVLVTEEGFQGSASVFNNSAGTLLNRVMDTRRGLPVALSVVWLDVARRLDWPMHGVGLPGHFIVSYDTDGQRILIDPFNQGALLSRESCEQLLRTMFGESAELHDAHLNTLAPRGILERMLGNLYAISVSAEDWEGAARALRRTVALRPDNVPLRAELGRLLTLGGRLDEATRVLAEAQRLARDDEEARLVDTHQTQLLRKLGENN